GGGRVVADGRVDVHGGRHGLAGEDRRLEHPGQPAV
ncbi:MAG: hypothetical protein AVDCRST_MAG30-636, partial [uncultured Solirubrobacteraceae bacterium]